jgi:hypothetical protein
MRLTLLGLVALGACKASVHTVHVLADTEIDASLRADMAKLDQTLLQKLQHQDPTATDLFAPELRAVVTAEQLHTIFDRHVASVAFHGLHDYEAHMTGQGSLPVGVPTQDSPRFLIYWDPIDGDSYVSLLDGAAANDDVVVGIRWFRTPGGWQVRNIGMGSYRVGGKTAAALLDDAEAHATRGETSEAAILMQAAAAMVRPFEWLEIGGLQARTDELGERLKASGKPYPIVFEVVPGKPKLFRLEPLVLEQHVMPRLRFVTTQSLSDKDAIRREALAMLGALDQYLPGVFAANDTFVFTASGEPPPEAGKAYTTFGVILSKKDLAAAP